ncbi:carboxypeptidase S1 [Apiospora hydei]|uniref:Carboxypeptidase n=1 Tax=Apiospora hydei TaxID=1337664 RepID=A0ABR1X562_9PEZI
MRISALFLAGALGLGTQAQFVSPPDDLKMVMGHAGVPVRYKQVEAGICELDPDVKSFSGYADVAEDQHIFWWFFEARRDDPENAPLTVWINGGPGSSSMMGLFQELGPCGVDPHGQVYSNPHSWTNVSNMLFIDQPTQTGFSYTKPVPAYKQDGELVELPDDGNNGDCRLYVDEPASCGTYTHPNLTLTAKSTEGAARNFWLTLQGFVGAFPQYAKNGLNLATESYGGHYGPVFSAYIERRNDHLTPSTVRIPLKTLLVGNGWFDPILGYQAFYNFTSGRDTICARADEFCANRVEYPCIDLLGRDEYDIRQLAPDPFPYTFFEDYLNTQRVQKALGAYTNFTKSNALVARAFRGPGTTPAINWLGVEAFAEQLVFEQDSSRLKGLAKAGYTDLRTSDGATHGQTKQAGRFSFTRVFESGHMVPFYQPLAALELFGRAISGQDVATGTERDVGPRYRTNGTAKSMYRNGEATLQWEVVPANRTYDVKTNGPGAYWDDVVRAPRWGVQNSNSFQPSTSPWTPTTNLNPPRSFTSRHPPLPNHPTQQLPVIIMANTEKNHGGDASTKVSIWDDLDELVDKLREKYDKEKKRGDTVCARHHHRTDNEGSTVQGANRGLAVADMPGAQARSSERNTSL